MSDTLGRCVVCGHEATVLYPLLPGEPTFCNKHHNPKDAGPFGCDFSGPDDFDPPEYEETTQHYQKLDPRTFIWTDIHGEEHRLRDIDNVYLRNIINYLEKEKGHCGDENRRRDVIAFLKREEGRRIAIQLQ